MQSSPAHWGYSSHHADDHGTPRDARFARAHHEEANSAGEASVALSSFILASIARSSGSSDGPNAFLTAMSACVAQLESESEGNKGDNTRRSPEWRFSLHD